MLWMRNLSRSRSIVSTPGRDSDLRWSTTKTPPSVAVVLRQRDNGAVQLVPPGPDRERMAREFEERSRAMFDALRRRPPFDVAGLMTPGLSPAALGEAGRSSAGWTTVAIHFGDPVAADGASVIVRTAVDRRSGVMEPDAVQVLEQAHRRLIDLGLADSDVAVQSVAARGTSLVLDHVRYPCSMHSRGSLWAARIELPDRGPPDAGLLVTVIGRNLNAGDVELGWLTDLTAVVDARVEFLARLMERTALLDEQERFDIPEGPAALRGIIEFSVNDTLGRASDPQPPSQRSHGRWRYELWQSAVRYQASVWKQSESQANDQVMAMVNQLTRLAVRASWFREDDDLRAAAITESIEQMTTGVPVASAPAHQAWLRHWMPRRGTASLGPPAAEELAEIRARAADLDASETAWLQRWSEWTANRSD